MVIKIVAGTIDFSTTQISVSVIAKKQVASSQLLKNYIDVIKLSKLDFQPNYLITS